MSSWYRKTEDFDIEYTEEIEQMVNKLHDLISPDDVYLYLFLLIYATDKLLSHIAGDDPEYFNELMTAEIDVEQLAGLVFAKMDMLYGNQEGKK